MMKRRRLFALLLALVMVISLAPMTAFAADGEPTEIGAAEVSEPLSDVTEETTEPSTEATESTTDPAPVCDCGTDDESIHAVTCGVYVAPENPVCYCAEKCTEANIWCDVCGVDYTQCSGTDTAAVYEDIVASGDCSAEGSNVQWKYDNAGTLTISGTGAMYSYYANQQPWYAYMESITAVVVEDGVTVVAGNSFDSFTSLKSVTIADSVVELGLQAFRACTNLVSVRLSSNLARIGQSAFGYCSSLTSIEIPQSVTSMGYNVFSHCTSLTSIKIPSGVTELKSKMFEQCTNLTSVTLPDTLTIIEPYAFTYCTSLASIEIPNSVTELGERAFDGCTSLASIEIPNSVTVLGKGAFWGCTALTEIKLPNALQTIPTYAFWDCSNLKDITIPASVTSVHYTAFTGIAASAVVHYLGTEAEYNAVFSEVLTKAAKHYCVEKDETLPVCNEPGHEKGWYCDTCAKYVDGGAETTRDPDNHAFSEKGICTRCGAYEAPVLANGYYEIGNMGQMFWFANYINTVDRTASAVLTADIDLENRPWTPIGSTGESSNNFRGVFDGQNHTIEGLYVEGSRAGLGFFGEVRTGTVKNFTIYGEVNVIGSYDYVGGVIGSACGLNGENDLARNGATIQNITSYVDLTAGAHGIGMVGGFIGYANHQTLIENCAWYGTFDAGIYRVDSGAGGFIGRIYDTATVTIRNCGAYGDIITAYKSGTSGNYDTIYIGGFLSYSPSGAKTVLENNLWAGRIINNTNLTAANAHLSAYGTMNSSASKTNCYALEGTPYVTTGNDNTNGITTVTAEQLKSGEIAYKLQNANEIWGQNIDTDAYPVLGGDKVYQVKNCKQEIAYNNSAADIGHNYVNGICTVCGEACEHTGGTATCTTLAVCDICGASYGEVDKTNHDETVAYVNGFCPNGCYEPAVRNGNVYEISNAGQLYWFAAQVNGGKNSDAKLTANIVVNENVLTADGELNGDGSEFRHWTPIGNEDVSYTGTFDGNGYTVSGLYFNDSTINCVGLFGKVFVRSVKNVGVIDSYLKGGINVGGVVGQNNFATVENCYNSGTVIGTESVGGVVGYNSETVQNCHNTGVVSGKERVGGLVGYNTDTVENCHNTGVVSGTKYVGGVVGYNWEIVQNCYNTGTVEGYDILSSVGGVVGYNLETVQNCYNTGTIVRSNLAYAGGVVGKNSDGTVTNTYYLDTVASRGIYGEDDVEGQAEAKTAEQFESGEVAYLLQGEQTEQVWGQNIGTDVSPNFTGKTVYGGYNTCAEDAGMAYSNEHLSAEKPDHSTTAANDKAATCTTKAYCSVCEGYYGEVDETNHVAYANGFCTVCGAACAHEGEEFTYSDNGDGTHDKVYADCGYVEVDNEEHYDDPATTTYTDNGNGTHSFKCAKCDADVTEAHKFTDGTCRCGALATYTVTVTELGSKGGNPYLTNTKKATHGRVFDTAIKMGENVDAWYTDVVKVKVGDRELVKGKDYTYNPQYVYLVIFDTSVTGPIEIFAQVNAKVTFELNGGDVEPGLKEQLVNGGLAVTDGEISMPLAYGVPSSFGSTVEVLNQIFLREGYCCTGLKNGDAAAVLDAPVKNCTLTVQWGAHSFTNGACVCGKQLFYGTNMTLGNTLDLNFAVEQNLVPDGAYAEISVSFADDRTDSKTLQKSQWTEQDSLYLITYKGLAAKEMCDTVTVKVYDSNKNLLGTREDSIRSYAERALKKEGINDTEITLLREMLDYGAEAQKHWDYNTENLANGGSYNTYTGESVTSEGCTAVGGNYMGTSLILESSIEMQMGFTGIEGIASAEVSYTDHYGNEKHFSGEGVTIETYHDTNDPTKVVLYGVVIPEIVVADARQPITVKVTPTTGKPITVTDSIAGYVARNNSEGIYGAIMDFADAAYDYFRSFKS